MTSLHIFSTFKRNFELDHTFLQTSGRIPMQALRIRVFKSSMAVTGVLYTLHVM